jgi:hypothetical protein
VSVAEQIRVEGLRELNRSLRQISRDLPPKLRMALNEGAEVVADAAQDEVPELTGAAAASIVPRSTRTAARIKAGGRRASHYPWLDFGGSVGPQKSVHRPFIREGRYLFPAYAENRDEMVAKLDEALVEVIAAAGLEASSDG